MMSMMRLFAVICLVAGTILVLVSEGLFVSTSSLHNPSDETLKRIPASDIENVVAAGSALTVSPMNHNTLPESLPLTLLYDLTLNLLTYASIFIPGYLIKRRYFSRGGPSYDGRGRWSALQRLCFAGRPDISDVLLDPESPSSSRSSLQHSSRDCAARMPRWVIVLYCFFGLQISYLAWGLIQEKIITRTYDGEHFGDSQFLVFMNRIIAFLISAVYLVIYRRSEPPHRAPYYKYLFSSFSNTMSSWFQYEALKYVSFPTQILAKASKIIPTMLMGKVVQGKTYPVSQYVSAGVITIGMTMFLYSRKNDSSSGMSTAVGSAVLVGYIVFDVFTSNWQEKLYKEYKMSSMQMMFGTNLFSVILTVISLLEGGGFVSGFGFAILHPEFLWDVLLLSTSSAAGQLFLFFTIKQFGSVVFITIMTVRQAIAILLSCFIYGHAVKAMGVVGVILVFMAVIYGIYANYRREKSNSVSRNDHSRPPKKNQTRYSFG